MYKKGGLILFVILIGAAVVFWVRFFSAEDSWICRNNEWIKHGNPSAPQPLSGCGESGILPQIKTGSASSSPGSPKGNIIPRFTSAQQISLTGLYVCLPARTGGTATTECALGLTTDDGNYFALNTEKMDSYIMYPTGTRLRVYGLFVPADAEGNDPVNKYNIKGTITLDKVEETE